MEPNVAASQNEPDPDTSSLQNTSTNPAEAGTTDETSRDDDHETSSIEALNWSEVDEEELAAAQQAETLAALAAEKLTSDKTLKKTAKDDDTVTHTGSSANEEGSVLSTSLLQSINSSASDEDRQAKKLSVIENWASEVSHAVERGEIEMTEDFAAENDDDDDEMHEGLRKRKGDKLSPEMLSSMISSVSTGDSIDPLSNAPVLDDGPIWNKGPRSYTFQENRRFNQKLTFCLLIAVVLAIGLGLGNLVAHQECEAEFKANQQSQTSKLSDKRPIDVPSPTTPSPIIPDRSTDSSVVSSTLPKKQILPVETEAEPDAIPTPDASEEQKDAADVTSQDKSDETVDVVENEPRRRKQDEPVIDPKYKLYADTVSSVVQTLDQLSRKIDQFENTTRKLQGVLMIPEEGTTQEETTEKSILEEAIEAVSNNLGSSEDDTIDNLINAIEENINFLQEQIDERGFKELRDMVNSESLQDDNNNELELDIDSSKATDKIEQGMKIVNQMKDFERRFIKKERKTLRESGKYKWFDTRLPEEYSEEEKNALRVRYRESWSEFLKLLESKVPNPIESLFGPEEEDEKTERATLERDPLTNLDTVVAQDVDDDFNDGKVEDVPDDDFGIHSADQDDPSKSTQNKGNLETGEPDEVVLQAFQNVYENLHKAPAMFAEIFEDLLDEMEYKQNVLLGKSVHTDESEENSQNVINEPTEPKSPEMPFTQNEQSQGKIDAGVIDKIKVDQKPKKLKQKVKNVDTTRYSEGNNQGGESGKVKSKGKKVKNVDGNKAFENFKGKNADKRRNASPEPQRKAKPGKDTRQTDKSNVKVDASKKAFGESTNKQTEFGKDEPIRAIPKQKPMKNNYDGGLEPPYINGKQRYQKHQSQTRPSNNDPSYFKDQKKKQQQWKESRENIPRSPKANSEEGKFSYKEPKNRQQKPDSKQRNDYQSSDSYQNGKKGKSWQGKEKNERREKSRERGSSWGN